MNSQPLWKEFFFSSKLDDSHLLRWLRWQNVQRARRRRKVVTKLFVTFCALGSHHHRNRRGWHSAQEHSAHLHSAQEDKGTVHKRTRAQCTVHQRTRRGVAQPASSESVRKCYRYLATWTPGHFLCVMSFHNVYKTNIQTLSKNITHIWPEPE